MELEEWQPPKAPTPFGHRPVVVVPGSEQQDDSKVAKNGEKEVNADIKEVADGAEKSPSRCH